MSDKLVRIKNRYDSARNWYNENPILEIGEIGFDTTNNEIRIGYGVPIPWTRLVPIGTRDFVSKHLIQIVNGHACISYFYIRCPSYNCQLFLARYNYMKIEIPGCFDIEFDIEFENIEDPETMPIIKQYPYIVKNTSSDGSGFVGVTGVYSLTDANMSKIGDIEFERIDYTNSGDGQIILNVNLNILDDSIFPKDGYLIATTTLKNIDKDIVLPPMVSD